MKWREKKGREGERNGEIWKKERRGSLGEGQHEGVMMGRQLVSKEAQKGKIRGVHGSSQF